MKLITPTLALSLAALTGQAQARDWGFSRDTVKEWDGVTYNEVIIDGVTYKGGLEDTLKIWNTGADTIWFDTAWLEAIKPEDPSQYFDFIGIDFGYTGEFPGSFWGTFPRDNPWPWPQIWVDKARNKTILGLRVGGGLTNEQIIPDTTLTIMRAIYQARGRGQDTLIVIGGYGCCNNGMYPTSLNRKIKPSSLSRKRSGRSSIDIQGRIQGDRVKHLQSHPAFSIPSSSKAGE